MKRGKFLKNLFAIAAAPAVLSQLVVPEPVIESIPEIEEPSFKMVFNKGLFQAGDIIKTGDGKMFHVTGELPCYARELTDKPNPIKIWLDVREPDLQRFKKMSEIYGEHSRV